jgi:hypothetical protein
MDRVAWRPLTLSHWGQTVYHPDVLERIASLERLVTLEGMEEELDIVLCSVKKATSRIRLSSVVEL